MRALCFGRGQEVNLTPLLRTNFKENFKRMICVIVNILTHTSVVAKNKEATYRPLKYIFSNRCGMG